MVGGVASALEFAETFMATNPIYAKANPQVAERLKKVTGQDKSYLAHEYFNKDWQPNYFSEMVDWLTPAKLTYACSSHLLDHLDAINLTAEQQTLLSGLTDVNFREGMRDFIVNQQFRKDYWVKGATRLSVPDQIEQLRALRLVLVKPRNDLSLKVIGSLGEADLTESIYGPILDCLADHESRTIATIEQAVAEMGINFAQVMQAAVVLTGAGHVAVANDVDRIDRSATDRLNAHLIKRAVGSADVAYLASPVTSGGVPVGRFQQLFLMAIRQGHAEPHEWARFVWSILAGQGQKLVIEGQTLESAEDNIAQLGEQASAFAEQYFPVLKALQVA